MNDYMLRVLAREAGVRAFVCVTGATVLEARRRHQAGPAATVALGYGLTGAALLGALLKIRQRVALKVEANGPLRKVVAESDSNGRLRGYVGEPGWQAPPEVDPHRIRATLGSLGLLTVVKDLGLKELYEGVIPLQTGLLDSDLVYYLTHSEQVPSLVEIGVKLDAGGALLAAGGLLIEHMPGHEVAALSTIAEHLDDMAPLAEVLARGQSPEEILAQIFAELPYEVLERHELRFECSCSWARSEKALLTLSRSDMEALIAEGQAVVDCHFCGERYIFGREALEMILERSLEA